jgi:hypothetical protein
MISGRKIGEAAREIGRTGISKWDAE